MINPIIEAIKKDLKTLPFTFTDKDILILSEWGYSLYMDGWNNAKILLVNKKNK